MRAGGVTRYVLVGLMVGGLLWQAGGPAEAGGGGAAGVPSAVQAAGRGYPWVNLQDGVPVGAGEGPLAAALGGTPQALAAGDFDADGVPDLAVGFGGAGGGQLALYRGNVDALYPHSAEAQARKRAGTFTAAPFLGVIGTLALPGAPDFVAVGDFDGDGHQDVVAAARGSQTLQLVPGDGRGNLRAARRLALPGTVTALGAGDVNRRDGLEDVVVGVTTPTGPQLLVFEGPEGALHATPEVLPMPGEVRAVAVGSVVTRALSDLVVAAGAAVVIVHGRDRKLALDPDRQAAVLPPRQTRQAFEAPVVAVTLGDFRGASRTEIALLDATGTVHLLGRAGASKPWAAEALFARPGGAAGAGGSQLLRVKVSSLPQDDLLILDPATRQLHVLLGDPAQVQAGQVLPGAGTLPLMTALETAAAPFAVLPMRLNRDALDDLVILQAGQGAPSVLLTEPVNVFIVTNELDSGPGSLRQAILDANASPGADGIDFDLSPTAIILPLTQLPRITEAVVLDGTTRTEGFVELNGNNRVIDGLVLGGGSSAVRGLVTIQFGLNDLHLASRGNLVEGNLIGITPNEFVATARGRAGVRVSGVGGNTIGGTALAARNVISGKTDGVIISGTAAAGNRILGNFIGTNATGTAAVANGFDGISVLDAPTSTIGGTVAGARNVIAGNQDDGVFITGGSATGSLVQGNFVGTNATGSAAVANADVGIRVFNAPTSTIGGTVAGARNVIAGNQVHGVFITGSATGSLVLGNFIGTNEAGTSGLGNAGIGAYIAASGTVVGGAVAGARNVIAANGQQGVRVQTASATQVLGNFIGTNASGTAALGNAQGGVLVDNAPATQIGGTTAGAGNLISGNSQDGVRVIGNNAAGAVLLGNFIGTNAAGTTALGNSLAGVLVDQAPAAQIGGMAAGAGNVISGNLQDGVRVNGSGAAGTVVQGNRIGTNATGTAALGNGGDGIFLGAPSATIGGTLAGARNLISGNGGAGIEVFSVAGTKMQGNFIGTTVTGTAALPNAGPGVRILAATGSSIGGTAASAGNTLAFNGGDGVFVESGTGNAIRRNAIFANTGLGIDLAPNGVTPNDPGDGDAGANNRQNFPVLTAVTSTATTTTITGSLNSVASSGFTLEFFRNLTCDGPANGEGRVFLRDVAVTTNASGNATFSVAVTPAVPAGQVVTATATRTATGDTSEFSACRAATLAGPSGKPPRGGGLPSITGE